MRLKLTAYIFPIFLLPLCQFTATGHAAAQTGAYRVTVAADPLSARIEGQIPIKEGRLFMAAWGADHLPNGWATFVRNFKVCDESGRELTFEAKPNGAWQLTDAKTGTVKISYEVDLSFTKTKWPYGNEQAGSFQDAALFIVSKALFVVADEPGPRQIEFETPASWKISAPWNTLNGRSSAFIAKDTNDLINNSLVLGKHVEYSFREGAFTFVVAFFGPMAKSQELVSSTLRMVVRNYVRIFDRTPRSKYLMTVFYSDQADAEAFSTSAAFTESEVLTRSNLIRWGNTLAHELFHSWNGHAIRGEDYATSQWFGEGFTEYFANLALVRERLITKELFIKKVENHLGLYLYFKSSPAFDGVSLKEAGSRKGRYRLGVYNGGWTAAFCLDLVIRESTSNRKNLVHLMRLMYERYGLSDKRFRYEDIVSAASDVAGRDVGDFFKRYVEGKETLPVQDYLKRLGFEGYTQSYDGEFYIVEPARINAQQRTLQRSLLMGL